MTIRVLDAGPFDTVQDVGRPGRGASGVPRSGAMDTLALKAANLLVGNDEGTAALETTLVGPTLRFDEQVLIALAGADLGMSADGVSLPLWRPIRRSCIGLPQPWPPWKRSTSSAPAA